LIQSLVRVNGNKVGDMEGKELAREYSELQLRTL
jgi:hypothetical protein